MNRKEIRKKYPKSFEYLSKFGITSKFIFGTDDFNSDVLWTIFLDMYLKEKGVFGGFIPEVSLSRGDGKIEPIVNYKLVVETHGTYNEELYVKGDDNHRVRLAELCIETLEENL